MTEFFTPEDLASASDGAESAFLSLVMGRELLQITRPEVRVVMDRYGAAGGIASGRLMAVALSRALGDRVITREETTALAYLQLLLDLAEDDAYWLRQRYVYPFFQNAAVSAQSDGRIDDGEWTSLHGLAEALRLSPSEQIMLVGRAVRDGFAALPPTEG